MTTGTGRSTRISPRSARRSRRRSRTGPGSLGLALNVWTVNDPQEIVRLARLGIDAVITDTPRVAIDALAGA